MEENNKAANNEIQIELSEEMAQGTYANLAIISHSASEFIFDFIRVVPGTPKAKVQSRIIMTPDTAQRLFFHVVKIYRINYISSQAKVHIYSGTAA